MRPTPTRNPRNLITTSEPRCSTSIKKSQFSGVRASVKNGVVDLEGTVKDFATKEELDKRVHRIKDVVAVRNEVQVEGAGKISDQEIADEAGPKIAI